MRPAVPRTPLTEEFSDADVAAALRAAGSDPAAIGRRGAELAAELLEKRRLAWQEKARKKLERAKPLFAPHTDYSTLGKPELLGLPDEVKSLVTAGVYSLYRVRDTVDQFVLVINANKFVIQVCSCH